MTSLIIRMAAGRIILLGILLGVLALAGAIR